MSDPIYRLRNVRKSYAGRVVLDVEHLDVYSGEVLAVVGPSGAGKSTLLRLMNFLEAPGSGSVQFMGHDYRSDQEMPLALRRRVTTVFQRPLLLNRTVWANVAYGLRLRGKRDARQAIHAALERVGMAKMARQRARTLSGGEAQRVALARAMVLAPDVLLLDEPTANLDPYNVGVIEDTIRALNQEHRTTLVLVTHNVFQAKRLAHRAALLLEGKPIEVAGIEAFFQAPNDARTRAFVRGDMVY